MPLPVGVVGPLHIDGRAFHVPMATTEGALLASTNRGCAAIRRAGGATTALLAEGMTRAPLVRMPSLTDAAALKAWLEVPTNFDAVAAAFNGTTRFGRLRSVVATTAGRLVYLRFKATTGDAMGMNMITKGVAAALSLLSAVFPQMSVLALSGNLCTDKKPSAINWIEGRGKSVSAEVRLSGHVLKHVLHTNARAMVELNTAKNLVGSALAGSVGGFNAHAANVVTAVFLATGQDGAQNVESSTCLTLMELDDTVVDTADPEGRDGPGIVMTVTMPSVEVGTVGGGTSLPAQAAALSMLGLRGSCSETPGAHAAQLARIVAGVTLAGELSLMSALTTNDLLKSHLKLNRKPAAAGTAVAPGAISERMRAKLAELASVQRLELEDAPSPTPHGTAATAHRGAASMSPAGSVPGGAPAGSHPHPLHLATPAGHTSPGRRFFAAPTLGGGAPHSSRHAAAGQSGAARTRAQTHHLAAATTAGTAFPWNQPLSTPGIDEESRSTFNEPMLSVP